MSPTLAVLFLATACAAESLTVFAAASTNTALTEIAARYEQETGIRIVCSFAASSTLAKQVELGAPADVFISANQEWMDHVVAVQAVQAASRRDLLANRLVIIVPANATVTIVPEVGFDIAASFTGRLAIGDPGHVPAGRYAQEALTALGWWAAMEPRLAPAADVRAALRLVEWGEAGAGVVYASDVIASDRVRIAAMLPETLHAPIRYPAALTSRAAPSAGAFLTYLAGPAASAIWQRRGFAVVAIPADPVGAP